jgi:hypothetical protein
MCSIIARKSLPSDREFSLVPTLCSKTNFKYLHSLSVFLSESHLLKGHDEPPYLVMALIKGMFSEPGHLDLTVPAEIEYSKALRTSSGKETRVVQNLTKRWSKNRVTSLNSYRAALWLSL